MNTMTEMQEIAAQKYEGFRQVEKAEFFKILYDKKLDVTPYPQGRWNDVIGYLSHWKTPSGGVWLMSDDYNGGKHPDGEAGRYWVDKSRFPAATPDESPCQCYDFDPREGHQPGCPLSK